MAVLLLPIRFSARPGPCSTRGNCRPRSSSRSKLRVREAGNGLPHLVPTLGSSPISSDAATRLPGTRFERRLAEILDHATAVFYEKGYERATLRDLSRASGISLAGLYYYFESKEELLYLIQKYYFTSVMAL